MSEKESKTIRETTQTGPAPEKKTPSKKQQKKRKRRIIIVVIIVIAVIAVTAGLARSRRSDSKSSDISTDKVVRRTLQSSISATGTLQSRKTTNVYASSSSASGLKVKKVNVDVGDQVQKGEVLCTFDVSAARENLSDAKKAQKSEEQTQQISLRSAQVSYDQAVKSRKSNLASAQKTLDKARKSKSEAQKAYKKAKKQVSDLKKSVRKLEKQVEEEAGNSRQTQSGQGSQSQQSQILQILQGSQGQQTQLQQELSEQQAALTQAQSSLEQMKSAISTADSAIDQAKTAYDQTKQSADSTVAAAKTQLDTAKASAGTSQTAAQVRTYQQIVDSGKLKAPVSGTITAVNVAKGDSYTGSAVVAIQDTDNLYVVTSIDESDISDVKNKMEVLVKTDATGDEQLKGKVTYISPTGSASSSSAAAGAADSSGLAGMSGMSSSTAAVSSGGTAYEVHIRFDKGEDTDNLRVDMTAKLSLIKGEVKNALAVPYDAIYTDKDGKQVVHKVTESADGRKTTENVRVNTGLESGYYVQILNTEGLTEGTEIEVPKAENSDSLEDAYQGMNASDGVN